MGGRRGGGGVVKPVAISLKSPRNTEMPVDSCPLANPACLKISACTTMAACCTVVCGNPFRLAMLSEKHLEPMSSIIQRRVGWIKPSTCLDKPGGSSWFQEYGLEAKLVSSTQPLSPAVLCRGTGQPHLFMPCGRDTWSRPDVITSQTFRLWSNTTSPPFQSCSPQWILARILQGRSERQQVLQRGREGGRWGGGEGLTA